MTIQNILFIGLGNMGAPMAANLLKHDYRVAVSDLNPEAVAQLTAQGAQPAADLAQAASQADAVISMLPAGKHVKSVYLGENGLFRHLTKNTLVIDCSTIATAEAIELAEAAHTHGLRFLDSPVSGGITGAAAGTLSFIVGGAQADFEAARPLFEAMGKNIFHAGGSGAGQTAKICNNMVLAVMMAATSEAIVLGVKNGLNPKVLSDIMAASTGGNWVLDRYNPYPGVMENVPAANGYRNGFLSSLMLKDLGIAADNAQALRFATPMAEAATRRYREIAAKGKENLDFSAVIGLYDENIV